MPRKMIVETAISIKNADWLGLSETRSIVKALGSERMRFVGGAVRDALLARPVTDIDVATLLEPVDVMARLEAVGIKAVASGFSHGTITAVTDSRSFEITTLRKDAETFGRHARVEFTDDWEIDASRRDFTINALYADAEGKVYDPLGGMSDLAGPVIRFIGDAFTRIEEDALRILRFFRLSAELGVKDIDQGGLKATVERKHLLGTLSSERIRNELLKLLAAPEPAACLMVMTEAGILREILPDISDLSGLRSLLISEDKQKVCDPLRRLYALICGNGGSVQKFSEALKLSRKESDRLAAMEKVIRLMAGSPEKQNLEEVLYTFGREAARDALYLTAGQDLGVRLKQLETQDIPIFPLSGAELKACGYSEGEALGKALATLEGKWIRGGFRASKKALLNELQKQQA